MNSRTLKIEQDGDFWKGKVKPKIRLKGSWLEKAGFRPGTHVIVKSLGQGVIELRSKEVATDPSSIFRQITLPGMDS